MTAVLPDGDIVVALLGIVMALALVSRDPAFARLSSNRRVLYGAIWAVLIGLVAALAARFEGG